MSGNIQVDLYGDPGALVHIDFCGEPWIELTEGEALSLMTQLQAVNLIREAARKQRKELGLPEEGEIEIIEFENDHPDTEPSEEGTSAE